MKAYTAPTEWAPPPPWSSSSGAPSSAVSPLTRRGRAVLVEARRGRVGGERGRGPVERRGPRATRPTRPEEEGDEEGEEVEEEGVGGEAWSTAAHIIPHHPLFYTRPPPSLALAPPPPPPPLLPASTVKTKTVAASF